MKTFATLIGPHGNPQFPHKLRNAVRGLWKVQLVSDAFSGDEKIENLFLEVISDAQTRYIRKAVKPGANLADLKEQYLYLMYIIRLGAWYDRKLEGRPWFLR